MLKKSFWLLVSFLMVISLVLAACGPAAVEEEEEEEEVVISEEEEEEEEEVIQKGFLPPENPKYGGLITTATSRDVHGFDPAVVMSIMTESIYFTHDHLIKGDWAKGPAGTGETDWLGFLCCNYDYMGPSLADSWEMPDKETLVFHLHEGAHFWPKPPANGREVTADDVVFCINREWSSTTSFAAVSWGLDSAPTSVKALDKYTVELKVPPAIQGLHLLSTGALCYIYPPEVIEQYGDFQDWRVMIGSGPWMLTDYVVGSGLTFERHPDYGFVDPNHPENTIPYADGMKRLIIADSSTRLAALRTGKVDYLQSLLWDDYRLLKEQHPELLSKTKYGEAYFLVARVDKPELPFSDVRVRQAMNLAMNQQEILDEYYEGQGEVLGWPWYSWKEHDKVYIPLEELPKTVQELFEYHPDKAKQLLAEAGYPNGFKTNIICNPTQVDLLSICREQLLAVGIDMEIKVLELGVHSSILRGRKHDEMITGGGKMHFIPWMMHEIRKESFDNCAYYENSRTRAAFDEVQLYVMKDMDKTWEILKEVTPFMLEQCVMGGMPPVPYAYHVWWPWLQNFFGATSMGYWEPETNLRYAWMDVEMKKAMGY